MSKTYTHGFLGCGKMAQIILQRMLQNKRVARSDVIVSRRNVGALKKLQRQLGVTTTQKNSSLAQSSRILWLGMKPFQAQLILQEVADFLRPETVVVSMMAGIPTSMLRKFLQKKLPILRIMPNTPALLGQGATGVYFTPGFPRSLQKKLTLALQDLGQVVRLKNERQFDAVTGLSGSGPAFVYLVAQGFMAGGKAAGLSSEQSRSLAIQTLRGATAMLGGTGQDPNELIAQVVSKGGTTEAGLKVLKKFKVERGIQGAVVKAAKRAREIGRGFK